MNHALQAVPFPPETLFIINRDGEPFVPVKPICENMGLSWQPQHRKLVAQKKRLTVTMLMTVGADKKQREMVCVPLRKTFAWLNTISPEKVAPHLKEKIELYQEECDEVLWNYWTKGVALNDRQMADVMVIKKSEYIRLLEEYSDTQRQLIGAQAQIIEYERNKPRRRRSYTLEEDAKLLELKAQGFGCAKIGAAMGRSKSSIASRIGTLRKRGEI